MQFIKDKDKILEELKEFIDRNCIFRCNPGVQYSESAPIGKIPSLTPLQMNSFQFMLRRLTHDPKMLSYVSALMFEKIVESINNETEYPNVQLCGLETSSIPIMIGIQQFAGRYGISINSFSIRKERKQYGLFHLIDGIPTESPVIVIDDTINSARSIHKSLDTCWYELKLKPAKNHYTIMTFQEQLMYLIKYKDHQSIAHSLFARHQFNCSYDAEKYWLPYDCDRTVNKRPEYK